MSRFQARKKGLMLPGLSFNAVSERAIKTAEKGGMRRSYWDWQEQIEANKSGAFPYTLQPICSMV